MKIVLSSNATTAPELFLHGHGAVLRPAIGSTSAVIDTKLPLTIRGVEFHDNAPPLNTQNGVLLTLEDVTIHDAQRISLAGPLVAHHLKIYNSADSAAIVLAGSYPITIDGALIYGGSSVLSIAAVSQVHLTNLMVFGTSSRALDLPFAVGELQFSTIAASGAFSQSAPCSVACGTSLHVTGSIIWQPTCANATVQDAVGQCSFASSIVSNMIAPSGTTNADPMFVSPAANNFHIQSLSPARDALDTGPTLDFEGDHRPGGTKFDIGADEIP